MKHFFQVFLARILFVFRIPITLQKSNLVINQRCFEKFYFSNFFFDDSVSVKKAESSRF